MSASSEMSDLTQGHVTPPPLPSMTTHHDRVGDSSAGHYPYPIPPMFKGPGISTGLQLQLGGQTPFAFERQSQCQT